MTDSSPPASSMPRSVPQDGSGALGREHEELQPLAVSTGRIVLWGIAAWAVALVVTLAVPALHEGDRDWWPWACVAGIVLGLMGYAYVRRGRGNAEGAE